MIVRNGSKAAMGAAQRVISEMPPHELYIEAFAGGAAVGRMKRPASQEIYIERDPDTAASLNRLMPDRQIVVGDCTRVIVPESIPDEAVLYADPPYLMSVRRSAKKYYRYELASDAEHDRMLSWLKRFRCRVLLSGYRSELYAARLEGWRLVQFGVPTRKGRALECLWCNFPSMLERHDTRFMGEGFRERERIKRKAVRWARRIQAMPPGERAAVLAALAGEVLPDPAGSSPAPVQARIVTSGDGISTPQLVLL
jgi:DNA adenine methylase